MSLKNFTLEEVAENNGKNGKPVWVIVKDSVYDITNFLNEHPGGDNMIRKLAGKDVTKEYNNVGHSSDANKDLINYKIGNYIKMDQPLPLSTLPTIISQSTKSLSTNSEKEKRKMKFLFCF